MPSKRVIVEVTPSRIEVALRRGTETTEWRSERFARAEWPAELAPAMTEAMPVLAKLVAELDATDASATVIYSAPGAVAALTSCAACIGASSAEQAARLALANVADFPVDDAPIDTCVLLTDKAVKAAKDAPAPAAPQMHVLTAADAEQRAAALAAFVESAGLTVDRLIPADAVAMAEAVRLAAADRAEDQVTAAVWIGEHSTILAAGVPGRLMFVRTIATGTESLVDALTRPLRPRDPEAAPVNLPHDAARAMFLAVGVPSPDMQIPDHPMLAGSSLLPHLQPVLQRLSIEIKQSLRFGVPESDRVRVRLMLVGPGAAIPGLGNAVSRVSGFTIADVQPGESDADAIDSSTGGLIAALGRCPNLTVSLMPAEIRRLAGQQRMRKALLVGIGVCAVFIGYETFDARLGLYREHALLRSITARAEAQKGATEVRERVFASRQTLSGVEGRVRKALGESPDFSAVLSILAEKTPESVRLNALDMSRDATGGKLNVHGYVRLSDAADPATVIKHYVDDLAGFPVVETVRLGATQRTQMRGHESQAFDLGVTVISLPPGGTLPATANTLTPATTPTHPVASVNEPENGK